MLSSFSTLMQRLLCAAVLACVAAAFVPRLIG